MDIPVLRRFIDGVMDIPVSQQRQELTFIREVGQSLVIETPAFEPWFLVLAKGPWEPINRG